METYLKIDRDHQDFPELLRGGSPDLECIYALGPLGILKMPMIGFCGSRSASANALRYAREFGQVAAKEGVSVVSGYAKGVDMEAHIGALEAGGATVAVLAEGIASFRVKRSLRHLDTSCLLALSQYPPETRWTVWRAMARNKVIVALASAMVVVEAGDKGGTLEAGLEAFKAQCPLFVIDYSLDRTGTEGNRLLMKKGGQPIHNMKELRALVRRLAEKQSVQADRFQGRLAI